jgi:DNA mismatch repair protein PMS2
VLRRGICIEQARGTSLEANFVSPNKQNNVDDCSLNSEAPLLRRGACLEQVRRTSLEGNFVSSNKQKHEDNCSVISETPVLRRRACSEQVRRTSLEANSPAALRSSTFNISEFNLPLETNSLKHHSPQSFVSVRADVSPKHSKPPNTVTHGAEVSSPCDVHTTEPDVVGKLFTVRYAALYIVVWRRLSYCQYLTSFCRCSYPACSLVILDTLVKCFACCS